MVFKRFYFQILLRVGLLTVALFLFSWCVANYLYLRSGYVAVAAIIILIELIWYLSRFNRDVKNLLTGLLQKDFTTHFQSQGNGKSFDQLYELLNQISDSFRNIGVQKEIQSRYFEMVFEHVRIGIMSIDANEKVNHANHALKDLLQLSIIPELKSLEVLNHDVVNCIREIRTGEVRLIKLRVNQELLQLSVHASEFKLDNKYYKLISMQNIRNELDAREMEGWQKLIRVLSHEIMNSVAPIMSLSSTLHGLVEQKKDLAEQDNSLYESLDKGLEAIKIRSEGLYNFTQTYRKLTGIPKLSLKEVNLREIISRVEVLMESKIKENRIQFNSDVSNIIVTVDPELMEHVLINLIINAIEAMNARTDPSITIHSTQNQKGNVLIHIHDNGEGMDESTLEKIFIPFFTTKKTGSGIGLAITKQILQLHHADILVSSELGKGTEFTIVI